MAWWTSWHCSWILAAPEDFGNQQASIGAVGEVTWTVSLLSVPDLRSAPTVADLEGYEAIRLFIDRALQRNPAFGRVPRTPKP